MVIETRVQEFGQQNDHVVLLLHGGGLSWWNYREVAKILSAQYHVVLPALDGHGDSDAPFTTIEENAARLISYIDTHFDGQVLAIGGLSLGGQVAVEILSQRSDICRYALLESALVMPMKLTAALIGPTFGMSYGLIKQKWFAKMQAGYLGIPKALFDDYFRDSAELLQRAIPGSSMKILSGLHHGDLSINKPEAYAKMLTDWIGR